MAEQIQRKSKPELQRLLDLVIAHQIDLQQFSNSQVQRIVAVLNRADADLYAELAEVLERAPESATAQYLESMLASVRTLNAAAYASLQAPVEQGMKDLAGSETRWLAGVYEQAVTVQLAAVSPETAWAAAFARPFQGVLLREALSELEAGRAKRIRDTVRMGFLQGETTDKIVRNLRGTRSRGYSDGITEIDRRHLESIVRTALSHTAATTRDTWAEANEATEVLWLSTLDSRTSNFGRLRDHTRYDAASHKPIGHSYPWEQGPGRSHWCCRSTALVLLPDQGKLFGTRASANGPVDANESYGAWLKRQPASVQDAVLGETRGALFRRGGLAIEDFSNDRGRLLTLEQLEQRNAAAFERAGVDA